MDELHADMKNENDEFQHKPWRVNTNVVRLLRPLSLCCNETHEHGVTHGVSAVPHGYYTDEMVKAIGEDITTQGEIAALSQQEEVPQGAGEMRPAAEVTNVRGPAPVPPTAVDESQERRKLASSSAGLPTYLS
eukprot:11934144-Heterocapsa_arctica.AAC.1